MGPRGRAVPPRRAAVAAGEPGCPPGAGARFARARSDAVARGPRGTARVAAGRRGRTTLGRDLERDGVRYAIAVTIVDYEREPVAAGYLRSEHGEDVRGIRQDDRGAENLRPLEAQRIAVRIAAARPIEVDLGTQVHTGIPSGRCDRNRLSRDCDGDGIRYAAEVTVVDREPEPIRTGQPRT